VRLVVVPPRLDLVLGDDVTAQQAGLEALVGQLDGLVGPGGDDVDPSLYGQANTHSLSTNAPRDRFEAQLARTAHDGDLFMLGVCRSHQLWNVALGGELIQDLEKEGVVSHSHVQHHSGLAMSEVFEVPASGARAGFAHTVQTAATGLLAGALGGAQNLLTNGWHHQAVKTAGVGMTVVAAHRDGGTGHDVIEATEGKNLLTVQWHPEFLSKGSASDAPLLAFAVDRMRDFKLARDA
jgi:putative glutamine amidotransferase